MIFQGPKGYIALICEVHLKYGFFLNLEPYLDKKELLFNYVVRVLYTKTAL